MEQALKAAYTMAERAARHLPPGMLCTTNQTIGQHVRQLGRAAEAETYMRRALQLVEGEEDGDEEFRLSIASELDHCLESQGKVGQTEALFRAELARPPPSRLEPAWRGPKEDTAMQITLSRRQLRCALAGLLAWQTQSEPKHEEALAIVREIREEALADVGGDVTRLDKADAEVWFKGANCLHWLGREDEALA